MVSSGLYAIISVVIISCISLIGIITLAWNRERLNTILIYFVSFAAGALLGDAFLHLLPHTVNEHGWHLMTSIAVLTGITVSFILEKFIHWHHDHTLDNVKPFAFMNLFGDAVHNFIDGLIIGATYLASIPAGIATTIAVAFHEIPQEIGDFAVLLHGGFSKAKALLLNFAVAVVAILGTLLALLLGDIHGFKEFLIPLAAGGFIYIAAADLIPELHKNGTTRQSLYQLIGFLLGVAIMFGLTLFEH
jgi:zinc and cadmium transporter